MRSRARVLFGLGLMIITINTRGKEGKYQINKSTLWYQQKKIKEGKEIRVYNKTRVKIE